MKKQIEVGELKVGDEFKEILSGPNGRTYVVSFVGHGVVEAFPIWDKNEEHGLTFQDGEIVEVVYEYN